MSRFAPKHTTTQDIQPQKYQHGYSSPTDTYAFISQPGLSPGTVEEISHHKSEPTWMRKHRLQALNIFQTKPLPVWGADLSTINFDAITYYLQPTAQESRSWADVPVDIKNTFDKLGIPQAERAVLAGVKAQFDCLGQDERILTTKGSIKIKHVQIGDIAFSLNLKTKKIVKQKITAKKNKGIRDIFKVTVAGRNLQVTGNHPFLNIYRTRNPGKSRGKFNVEWKYLSNLKVGDYIGILTKFPLTGQRYHFNSSSNVFTSTYQGKNQLQTFEVTTNKLYSRTQPNIKIPTYSSTNLMWFLGLFIGDGILTRTSKNQTKNVVDLAIPQSAKTMRAKVYRVVKEQFGYKFNKYQSRDPYRIKIVSKPITQFIKSIGFDYLAKTKRLPEWIYTLTPKERHAFIAGYIDADGTLRNNPTHKDCTITSANQRLLEQVQVLASDVNLHTSNVFQFTSKAFGQKHTGYRLIFSGDLTPLAPYCVKLTNQNLHKKYFHNYKTAYRSSIQTHTGSDWGFAQISHIEKIGKQEVYDIEVSSEHNFISHGIIAHNSEVIYGSIKKMLKNLGVIFISMDEALAKHPDLVKRYFGTLIPAADNKFSALNSAVWSGGSFVYVPRGVEVKLPLQAYFRLNAPKAGQFERTLIIAEEGSKVHYVEGCSAPAYSSESLHSAVVEIFVGKGARVQYTTVQNWYKTVYNLVTKRARVEAEGEMVWTDFNMGSKLTMKYPGFILAGKGARGETLSMALAGSGQHQDTGSKAIHLAPHTSSTITSKSISKGGGRTSYRGLVNIAPGAHHSKSRVVCDALLLDDRSRSDTYPTNRIYTSDVSLEHEASVSKIGEEQLFYLMSRGLSEEAAAKMIVSGFVAPLIKQLPLEYAVEMNRLIDMEMQGSIG